MKNIGLVCLLLVAGKENRKGTLFHGMQYA